jgi:hypothetical protein
MTRCGGGGVDGYQLCKMDFGSFLKFTKPWPGQPTKKGQRSYIGVSYSVVTSRQFVLSAISLFYFHLSWHCTNYIWEWVFTLIASVF